MSALPADFPRPTPHDFERQPGTEECAVCSMPQDTHRETAFDPEPTPEPEAGWERGDLVLSPLSGRFFYAQGDGFGGIEWLELTPTASHAQRNAPKNAVLLSRGGRAVQR